MRFLLATAVFLIGTARLFWADDGFGGLMMLGALLALALLSGRAAFGWIRGPA